MTNRNSKVLATDEFAPAVERAAAPILLAGRDLEVVAAAGGISGGVVGSRNQPSAR